MAHPHCTPLLTSLLATIAIAAVSAFAPGQSVAVSAPVPTTLLVHSGGTPQTSQLGPGPMVPIGTASLQVANGSRADFFWTAAANASSVVVDARARNVLTVGSGLAAVAPGRLLFAVTLPYTGLAEFELRIDLLGTAGAAIPRVAIDVGADGVPELTQAGPFLQATLAMPVGTSPLPIQIDVDAALAVAGTLDASARVVVRPLHGVLATEVFPGCSPERFWVGATWSGDVDYQVFTGVGQPALVVFGLNVQPQLLPRATTLPCVLFPAPLAAVFVPDFAVRRLTIPAALRPLTIWAEAVVLEGAGPLTTSTWRIQAN